MTFLTLLPNGSTTVLSALLTVAAANHAVVPPIKDHSARAAHPATMLAVAASPSCRSQVASAGPADVRIVSADFQLNTAGR